MHCIVQINGRYRSVHLFETDILILRNIADSGSDLVNGCIIVELCPPGYRVFIAPVIQHRMKCFERNCTTVGCMATECTELIRTLIVEVYELCGEREHYLVEGHLLTTNDRWVHIRRLDLWVTVLGPMVGN